MVFKSLHEIQLTTTTINLRQRKLIRLEDKPTYLYCRVITTVLKKRKDVEGIVASGGAGHGVM